MRKPRFAWLVGLIAVFALVGAACATDEEGGGSGGTGGGTETLLDQIKADGTLKVSTDPKYPPQSSYDPASDTWEGFDIDVATEIAKRMGVEVQWETPAWEAITAGKWNGRWDLSVGSMTVTEERAQVLDFSDPYYFTPAGIAVAEGSDITSLEQLSGKKIGVCGSCSYQFYLERKLNIPGYDFEYQIPEDVSLTTYDTDSTAIQDLVIGRTDAVMSAVPTIQGAIDSGEKISLLGEPVFYEPLAVAADKNSSLSSDTLIAEVTKIIEEMHSDGTLKQLSEKWYGEDLTQAQTQ